jgi:hypothetical protein
LERAPDLEPGPDLAYVVIEDRLPALIAQLDSHLPQPQRLDARVSLQLLADPVLERIELRPVDARSYLGGTSLINARVIVSRCAPVSRWIARFERFSTKNNRLISAHCSTPIHTSSSPDRSIRRGSGTSRTTPTQRQAVQFSQ